MARIVPAWQWSYGDARGIVFGSSLLTEALK